MTPRLNSLGIMFLTCMPGCNDGAKFYGHSNEEVGLSHIEDVPSLPPPNEDMTEAPEQVQKGIGDVSDVPAKPTPPSMLERTFLAAEYASHLSILDESTHEISETLTLKGVYGDASETFIVPEAPTQMEIFTQGHKGEVRTSQFTASEAGLLDILVVIDNSSSMSEEQGRLAPQLAPLLSVIENTNWRIGVIKTEHQNSSCLHAIIDKGVDRAINISQFNAAINVGTKMGTEEEGIRQAHHALTCPQTPWLRSGSSLAILIVSDEDNCTDGNGCPNSIWKTEQPFIDYLNTIRKVGEDARVYGIYMEPLKAGEPKTCLTGNAPANIYQRLIKATGGTAGSICDSSYEGTLRAISLDMKQIIKNQFQLDSRPNPGSLKITIDNKILPPDKYKIDGSVVELLEDKKMTPDTKIEIEYEVGGVPIMKEFPLSAGNYKIREKDLEVYIDGIIQHKSQYHLKDDVLSFTVEPPEYAKIEIKYRRDEPHNKTFKLSSKGKKGKCKVLVNNIEKNAGKDFSCDAASGEVSFFEDVNDRDEIKVEYESFKEKKLRYSVGIKITNKDTIADDLQAYDVNSGDTIDIEYEDGAVIVADKDFIEERQIVVRYISVDELYKVDISGQQIIPESIIVTGVGKSCSHDDIRITSNELIIMCPSLKGEKVNVAYDVLKEVYYEYQFDLMDDIENHEVRVFINGVETAEFKVHKNLISLNEGVDLDPDDSITVQVRIND